MADKIELTIIDEKLDAENARKMLVDILRTEAQYYSMEGFSKFVRCGTPATCHDYKINRLNSMIEQIKQLADNAGAGNQKLTVKGTIELIVE